MTIAFAGHSLITSNKKVKEMVKEQIRNHIIDDELVTCYLGGYGDFDTICAYACKELKQEYKDIEAIYVTPYISLSEQEKIKEMNRCGLCDMSIYPPIENVPLRFAILKRNEWMMKNADLIIAYVKRNYGGAYKSLQVAKRKKKKIINIYDLI
ncbi:MAG: DUF1273 family protein [Ruminococcaceae bacterium]|nr:DUF1273 family protein [Oscillospiraceae bacterium]